MIKKFFFHIDILQWQIAEKSLVTKRLSASEFIWLSVYCNDKNPSKISLWSYHTMGGNFEWFWLKITSDLFLKQLNDRYKETLQIKCASHLFDLSLATFWHGFRIKRNNVCLRGRLIISTIYWQTKKIDVYCVPSYYTENKLLCCLLWLLMSLLYIFSNLSSCPNVIKW